MKSREACPICTRLPRECSFFSRVRFLKFAADPVASAIKRAAYFERYHADICDTCKRDVADCRTRKVRRVSALCHKFRGGPSENMDYLEDDQFTAEVKRLKCRKIVRGYGQFKYVPVLPDWWRLAKGMK